MCIAGEHVDALNIITRHLELYHLIGAQFALLNEAMTGHNYKELPLRIVPVLAFGDARFADIDTHLSFGSSKP